MTKWLSLLCAWGLVAQVGCAEAPAPAQREAAPVTRIGTHDSKWDAKTLEKHPSAERVDVALLLVDALKPNGK